MKMGGKEYPLNEVFKVEVDDQLIQEEGQVEVRNYVLRSEAARKLPYWESNIQFPKDFDWHWLTRRGTLPKRISSTLYNDRGLNLSNQEQADIGRIASAHIRPANQSWVDLTDDFNWVPGRYADPNSCYWGSRAYSRIILEEIGGYAIRGYTEIGKGEFASKARAWVYPAPWPDHWLVMNGYGWDTRVFAAIVAQMNGTGFAPCQIRATPGGSLLYINGGSGYLIGTRTEASVTVSVPNNGEHNSCSCGRIKDTRQSKCRKCRREDAERLLASHAAAEAKAQLAAQQLEREEEGSATLNEAN